MKSIRAAFLPLLLAVASTAHAAENPDEAKILKIGKDMAAAQTAAEFLKDFAPDAVMDAFFPGQARGSKAVATAATTLFAGTKDLRATILKMSISTDHDIAYAFSTQRVVFTNIAMNKVQDWVFRQVDCYRKVNGKWLVVYHNLSVPFDPTTGKAVFDAPV